MPAIKVQSRGRITLPAPIRQQANIEAGDLLSVSWDENKIVLTCKDDYPKSILTNMPNVSEKGWEWLKHFDAEEQKEFLIELLGTIREVTERGNWEIVVQLVEEWKATANINAQPDLVQAIETAEADFAQGKGISWAALREELKL